MKALLFSLMILAQGSLLAQFSKSFFETLRPEPSNKIGHYYGTAITNGALGVRLADSMNTEVQWVKIDLDGHYQTFSAHLPTDYISPNERIIEVFESANNQFIVSQDSASNNNEGIRIYKYQDYTESAGVFELPVQLRNAYFQAYFKFGKIFVLYVESGVGMRMLKVNPVTLQMEANLLLGSVSYDTQSTVHHFKKTHVLFEDENNMQLFASSSAHGLFRIKIVDNVAQPLESTGLNPIRVLGVNPSNDQVICLSNGLTNMKKYHLSFDQEMSQLSLSDSLYLEGGIGPNSAWRYANDGGEREFFAFDNEVMLVIGNTEIQRNTTEYFPTYSNLAFLNERPLLFGFRYINSGMLADAPASLMISWGYLGELLDFKEYGGIYDFGSYKLRSGIGNSIMPITESSSAWGDFIFDRLIYSGSLMLAGKSQGMYYGLNPEYMDNVFKPGPYTDPAVYDQEVVHYFHQNFYVNRAMVYYHVAAIANNVPGYVIPKGIRDWPAHGDQAKGQAFFLAPFEDINANGIYEPEQGEYPAFPGTRCLFNITHQHETDGSNQGLGVELHNYVYNFDCEDTLKDVVFYKTEVFNRSGRDLDSLALGVYSDFDLGGFNDDYIGTQVERSLVYAYNGDNYDDSQNGLQGFNDSLPAIGNVLLKGVKFAANGQDDQSGVSASQSVNGYGFGDGIADNEYRGLEYSAYFTSSGAAASQSDPNTPAQVYNYLGGKWRFGDEKVYGGTGFPGSAGATSITARYYFPGDSDPLNYGTAGVEPGFAWDELTNNNPSGDRRAIASFGMVPLASGEKMEYHFAYLAAKRIPGPNLAQEDLFARTAHVQHAFNANLTACGQNFENLDQEEVTGIKAQEKASLVLVYPNPVTDELRIDLSALTQNCQLEVLDIQGKSVLSREMKPGLNSLDLSACQKGMYFLKISSPEVRELVRLVKN